MDTEGFKYHAFISYSHKDKKIAQRLHKRLRRYHLPSVLRRLHPELPKKLGTIFLDEANLVAKDGSLTESLRGYLDASNYLILICSPDSAKSEYVNDEVEYFMKIGRRKHIVPLIVRGVPRSKDPNAECFVPAVLDTKIYDEVIAVSDEDALGMGRMLGRTEGFLAGISSGAVLWAAVQLAMRGENEGKVIAAVFPDTGERYLSSGMFG